MNVQLFHAVGPVAHTQVRAVLESIIGMLFDRLVNVHLFGSASLRPILQALCFQFVEKRSLAQVEVSGTAAMAKSCRDMDSLGMNGFRGSSTYTFGFLLGRTQKDRVTEITNSIRMCTSIEASEKASDSSAKRTRTEKDHCMVLLEGRLPSFSEH